MKPIIQADLELIDYLTDDGTAILTMCATSSTGALREIGVPVTILPGHLADSLRWRKVGEEEPEEKKKYVVDECGLACYQPIGDGVFRWHHVSTGALYSVYPDDLYRPAIPGIDYPEKLNDESTK